MPTNPIDNYYLDGAKFYDWLRKHGITYATIVRQNPTAMRRLNIAANSGGAITVYVADEILTANNLHLHLLPADMYVPRDRTLREA